MQQYSRIAFLACAVLFTGQAQDRLVKFHVIALDNHDEPVRDLAADDFQVQERGKSLPVAWAHKDAPNPAVEPPLGPHEFSNRGGLTPASIAVILFDLLHTVDEKFARAQLTKAAANFRGGEGVYLYFLTGRGPFPLRGLPEQPGEPANGGPIAKDQIDAAYDAAKRMNADNYDEEEFGLAFRLLQSMASRIARLPGRKSIVWISRGVAISASTAQPGLARDYSAEVRRLVGTLQGGNIGLYPVGDARRDVGSQALGTVNEIATRTGGRSHMDLNIGSAIQEAMDDSRSGYTLSFGAPDSEDKYHKVRVTCSRRGIRIVGPDGYYPFAAAIASNAGHLLEEAQSSAFDATGIGLRADVSPSKKSPQAVHFNVRINQNDLRILRKDSGYTGELSLVLTAYDSSGKQKTLSETGYPFQLSAEQYDLAVHKGITLSPDQRVPDDVKMIRVIIFDKGSNSVGSVTVPIGGGDRSPGQ